MESEEWNVYLSSMDLIISNFPTFRNMSTLSFFGRLMERVLICVKEENDDDGESWMLLGVLFVGGTLFTMVFQGEFLDVV